MTELPANQPPLSRRLVAEAIGSLLLAALVVGSGIAAQQLSPGQVGLQLVENAAATAAGLYAITLIVGPVSGAHLNPVVTLLDAAFGGIPWRETSAYLAVQIGGCVGGTVLANLMFTRPAMSLSTHHRASGAHLLAEIVATAGLTLLIFSLARSGRAEHAPAAVGAYIGAAYWFTSSTSFANPAITIGRSFSDTFAGIAPASAPAFIAAQLAGGALGYALVRALHPHPTPPARPPGRPALAPASTKPDHPPAPPQDRRFRSAPHSAPSPERTGPCPTDPRCCSSASTMPVAPKWQQAS
jgi:arsenate reductase